MLNYDKGYCEIHCEGDFDAAMSLDVFISYSSKDKQAADAACAALEAANLRCWIAPRDILPGADWNASIIDALDRCHVLVLIFSASANESPQIRNEVVHAVQRGVSVIPFRIEDIAPAKALAYFMARVHWLDALSPPLEKHLQRLAESGGGRRLHCNEGRGRTWNSDLVGLIELEYRPDDLGLSEILFGARLPHLGNECAAASSKRSKAPRDIQPNMIFRGWSLNLSAFGPLRLEPQV